MDTTAFGFNCFAAGAAIATALTAATRGDLIGGVIFVCLAALCLRIARNVAS